MKQKDTCIQINRRAVLGAGAGIALGLPARAQSPTRTLRIGLITPPPHNWTKSAAAFGADLESATDGRLKLAVFPSGQLGSEAQMLQLLQIGALDFGFFTTSEFANRLPDFAAFYAPYIVENATQAAALLEQPAAQGILKAVERIGLVGLGYGMAGMRQVVSSRSIQDPSDLRGLKVRVVPDAPLTDFWRAAGCAPSPISLSSLYDAFANGQIDAMHIDFENTLRQKFYEHATTIVHSDHMVFPLVAVASRRAWESLSAADQEIISQLLAPTLRELREAYAVADMQFKADLIATGKPMLEVGPEFFENAATRWERRWRTRTAYIEALRDDAFGLERAS